MTRLLLLLSLLVFAVAAPVQATTIISEDYEVTAGNLCAAGQPVTDLTAKGWTIICSGADVADIVASPMPAGGKALRFTYTAPFVDNVNDVRLGKSFSGGSELYGKVNVYYSAIDGAQTSGFVTPTDPSSKQHIYNVGGPGSFVYEYLYFSGGSSDPTHEPFIIDTHPAYTETCASQGGAQSAACPFIPNAGSLTVPFNQMVCLEYHVKANTPGLQNGIVETWQNGTPISSYSTAKFFNTGDTPVFFGMQVYRQAAVNLYRYEDDFTLSTTRIGCGGTLPPADTTPPTPNPITTLAVSTAGAVTWTPPTDSGSGMASQTLLRSTGNGVTPTQTLITLGPTTSSYTDTSIIAGTVYNYAIIGTDNSGNSTTQSATVTITAASVTPPSVAFVAASYAANYIAGSASSNAATTPVAVTSGHLLVAATTFPNGGSNHVVSSVADTAGNTWTFGTSCGDNVSGGGHVELWYAMNTKAGATTVTSTFSGAESGSILFLLEYTGLATSAALDQTACALQVTPGTGANAVTTGAKTTAVDGELIFGLSMTSNQGAMTEGTGFTFRDLVNGNVFPEDKVQSTAGSVAATWTDSDGISSNTSAMLTFKPSTGTTLGRSTSATYTPSGTSADLGTSWDPHSSGTNYTGKNPLVQASSTIQAQAIGTDSMATYNGIATPNDQWEQVPLTAFTGTKPQVACVSLRTANAPTVTGYLICAERNGGAGVTTLIQKLDGVTNPILSSESSTAWGATDYLRGEIQGSTLKAIRGFSSSEATLLTANDTTYTSGKAGLLIFIDTGGALTDIQLGTVTIGGFGAASPPAITSVTNVSRTQATVGWSLVTLPTSIRFYTGNGTGVSYTVTDLSTLPGGVFTYPPTILNALSNYLCAIARDSGGNEIPNSQQCNSVPAAPIDTAPAVLTLSSPIGTIGAGLTTATLAVTLDKPVPCRYDTTDQAGADYAAYLALANAMTTSSLTASAGLTGLSAGTIHEYVRCNFVDAAGTNHPNPTSLDVSVTVAASSPDTTPPSTVVMTGLTAISPTQVQGTWNAATAHGTKTITGYQVSISYGASNVTYNLVGTPVTATTIITDVPPNTVVNMVVTAIDSLNFPSAALSNVQTVTTPVQPNGSIPSTMTKLRVYSGPYTASVELTSDVCVDTSGPCTKTIEVSPLVNGVCTGYVFVYNKLADIAFIGNLVPSTGYCVRGLFNNGTNNSMAYSNVVQFTTAATGRDGPASTIPFGVTRGTPSRDTAGTRATRP